MPLNTQLRKDVKQQIELYEGRFNHLYLDTRGKVTVGVGHLVIHRNAMTGLTFYTVKNKLPSKMARLQEKLVEYDAIAKQPWGQCYGADWYKQHATLIMKDIDISLLLEKHINIFYTELTGVYQMSNGYPADFDNLPKNVQLALFDMIFNLGRTKLVSQFVNFNHALKASDWQQAAQESNRIGINPARNQYVKQLLLSVTTLLPLTGNP